jgi:hypothetical protein
VLHPPALGEPDETTRAVFALVRVQDSVEDVHAVSVWVGVPDVGEARRVSEHEHLHARVGIGKQFLGGDFGTDLRDDEHRPRHAARVRDGEFYLVARYLHVTRLLSTSPASVAGIRAEL